MPVKEEKAMPVINMAATGQNIHDMRIRANMTIKDIQTACGVTSTSVCNWQSGRSMPSIDNLVILASIWDVRINDILITW